MPIARAFTKRLRSESNSLRTFIAPNGKSIKSREISLPVSLLSTTNPLSHDAPDIADAQLAAAQGKLDTTGAFMTYATPRPREYYQSEDQLCKEDSENPGLDSSRTSEDSPSPKIGSPSTPTDTPPLTDGSSIESSPALEYNHLSCYFPNQSVKRGKSTRSVAKAGLVTAEIDAHHAPTLPTRVPSHSKREHERLAHKRSIRRSGSGASKKVPGSISEKTDDPIRSGMAVTPAPIETTTGMARSDSVAEPDVAASIPSPLSPGATSVYSPLSASSHHPFTSELEQLNEMAEEFHCLTQETQKAQEKRDAQIITDNGCKRFTVMDYVGEIGWLYNPTDGGYVW